MTLLKHVPAATGELVVGGRMSVKVGADTTGDVYTCMRGHTPPGLGPPLHVHGLEDETFYVLRGTYEMHCGDEVVTVEAGTCLHMPKHLPHTFLNVGETPGELLEVMTPGGLDRYFRAIEHLGAVADDLPARNEIGRRYGLEFFTDLSEFRGAPDGATVRPFVVRAPSEGRATELAGYDAVCMMERDETAGSHEVHELSVGAGKTIELPPSGNEHLCVVLEGELAISTNGEEVRAREWDVVAMTGESGPVIACADGRPARFLLYSIAPSA